VQTDSSPTHARPPPMQSNAPTATAAAGQRESGGMRRRRVLSGRGDGLATRGPCPVAGLGGLRTIVQCRAGGQSAIPLRAHRGKAGSRSAGRQRRAIGAGCHKLGRTRVAGFPGAATLAIGESRRRALPEWPGRARGARTSHACGPTPAVRLSARVSRPPLAPCRWPRRDPLAPRRKRTAAAPRRAPRTLRRRSPRRRGRRAAGGRTRAS